jgi:hypothetical protein
MELAADVDPHAYEEDSSMENNEVEAELQEATGMSMGLLGCDQ